MNHHLSAKRLSMAVLVLAAGGVLGQACAGDDLAARRQAFNALLDEQWQYTLKDTPEFATTIGDYRYNDQLSDLSLAHVEQHRKADEAFLKRFQAVDTSGFSEQDRLSEELMVKQLQDDLKSIALKNYEMPLDQFNGTQLQLAQLVSVIPFDSTRHYED